MIRHIAQVNYFSYLASEMLQHAIERAQSIITHHIISDIIYPSLNIPQSVARTGREPKKKNKEIVNSTIAYKNI